MLCPKWFDGAAQLSGIGTGIDREVEVAGLDVEPRVRAQQLVDVDQVYTFER